MNANSVPDTVPSARHTMVSKTYMVAVPMETTVLLSGTDINKIKNTNYRL